MKIREITESREQLDEWLPLIGAVVRTAGPWLMRQGAQMLAKRGAAAAAGRAAAGAATRGAAGRAVTGAGVGAAAKGIGQGLGALGRGAGAAAIGFTVADIWQTAKQGTEALGNLIEEMLGPEAFAKVAALASRYGIHLLIAVAIFYGGKKILDMARQQQPQQQPVEAQHKIGQAAQVKGKEPMPKAEPGRTEHPFKGRLVGGIHETATAGGTSAGGVASVFTPVGQKKKKTKLIKR